MPKFHVNTTLEFFAYHSKTRDKKEVSSSLEANEVTHVNNNINALINAFATFRFLF